MVRESISYSHQVERLRETKHRLRTNILKYQSKFTIICKYLYQIFRNICNLHEVEKPCARWGKLFTNIFQIFSKYPTTALNTVPSIHISQSMSPSNTQKSSHQVERLQEYRYPGENITHLSSYLLSAALTCLKSFASSGTTSRTTSKVPLGG